MHQGHLHQRRLRCASGPAVPRYDRRWVRVVRLRVVRLRVVAVGVDPMDTIVPRVM